MKLNFLLVGFLVKTYFHSTATSAEHYLVVVLCLASRCHCKQRRTSSCDFIIFPVEKQMQ